MRKKGSKLLGRELRLRRGHRSYAQMAQLSRTPPLAGRFEPVSPSYLHKVEHGERVPSLERLRTIGALYGITVEQMVRLFEADSLAGIEPRGETVGELLQESSAALHRGDYRLGFAASLRAQEWAATAEERCAAIADKAACLWRLGLPRLAAQEVQGLLADPRLPPRLHLRAYSLLAGIFHTMWNLSLAEDFARLGLQRAHGEQDALARARLMGTLGTVLIDRARLGARDAGPLCREALRFHAEARRSFEALGLGPETAASVTGMGTANWIALDRSLGMDLLAEGLEAGRRAQAPRELACALEELGRALLEVGEWASARRHLQEAVSTARRAGCTDVQFRALARLADGAMENGEDPDPFLGEAQGLLPLVEHGIPERARLEKELARRGAAQWKKEQKGLRE